MLTAPGWSGLVVVDRDVPGLRRHAPDPGAYRWVRFEFEAALVGNVGVRVEGNVRDRVPAAHQEIFLRQINFHDPEEGVAQLADGF